MDQRRDILSEQWKCGLTNRSFVRIATLIDSALLIIGVALFIRSAIYVFDAQMYIVLDFLVQMTSSFNVILGFMTLRKMRSHQNVAFLRHYVIVKLIHILLLAIAKGIYIQIECKEGSIDDNDRQTCSYIDLGLYVVVPWFIVQIILLYSLFGISKTAENDARLQAQIILIDNRNQAAAASMSTEEQALRDKSFAVVVECEGIPFSLVNSGPLDFKIIESLSLKKAKALKQNEKETVKVEPVDLRYLFMSKTNPNSNPHSNINANSNINPNANLNFNMSGNNNENYQRPNRRRFEDDTGLGENIRRLGDIDIMENDQDAYIAINLNHRENGLEPGILTRSKEISYCRISVI